MLFLVILLALIFIVSNVLGANYHTIANADSPNYGDLVNAFRSEADCKSYCDSIANCAGAAHLHHADICYIKSDIAKIVPLLSVNLLIKVVGPFLRIDSPPSTDIMLREVRLYNNGVPLFGLYATMSRTFSDSARFRPSKCIDNDVNDVNDEGICHSTGPNPWLVIDLRGQQANKIVIYNRENCCGERIVGANVKYTNDYVGNDITWRSNIPNVVRPDYTFNIW
jgi:hypothetical protein